ncbi:MAG TPA: ATP-binding protein [Pyrinomonadaceae bacterium]
MSKAFSDGPPASDFIRHSALAHSAPELAPRSDWRDAGDCEHFVQFYDTDAFLLNSLCDFVRCGLDAGDACVVVATKAHREALEEGLRARGLDVAEAIGRGQFVALDAAGTLSEFMVGGSPEPARFAEVIGGLVARVAGGGRRVRVFGEMVDLLWAEQNHAAAISLERLWNDLQKTRPFQLFCAYPANGFGGGALAAPLSDVCASHSRVIPAESYTALDSADARLRAIIELQQKAASLEAELAERGRLLASEQAARAEAEAANRMKDEFLATVSHELRTPLNAIIGWAHMLRTESFDAATFSRGLATIERNAHSQAQLIEDILDVSRVVAGKLRLNVGPVDLASVINAAVDAVQLAADSKAVRLIVTLDPSTRHVSGDAGRLQQVVWNLLSNAIKFTPEGGRVEVRLGRDGRDVRIEVSDTGQGVAPEFLPHVFDAFRQADGTSTRRHGGLGLGLAIVRHLVELHGGSVAADSHGEGLGASFTIRLPSAPAPEPAGGWHGSGLPAAAADEDAGAHRDPHATLEGVRVLLVDDDRDTLNMLATALTACQASVQTASSADDALEALRWFRPDVLVSDLAMPGEDGYSLIARLRALGAEAGGNIPAVALTAYVRVKDRTRALAAGFNMFVPKPVEPNELIAAVANLTESAAN